MTTLPLPEPGRRPAEQFVRRHLTHLCRDEVRGSPRFRGGRAAAESALAAFDVAGYARDRNEVWPVEARGASQLSPWIRHGLLGLRRVWRSVEGGPARDVRRFRDELLWQEYARHWYARHGARSGRGIRRELAARRPQGAWERDMACVAAAVDELEADGWLVNQQRMWLASHWAVRNGADWRQGEEEFFAHLLDGSRAANRLGWQWVTGVGSARPYGFRREQVETRAAGTCAGCPRAGDCPIEDWPADPPYVEAPGPAGEPRGDLAGPREVERAGAPDLVWLTAESLGDDDPALSANPGLPAAFVFDEPLLRHLRLSSKRLVFLVETLAELGTRREVVTLRGRPSIELGQAKLAVTHAPVPGFGRRAAALEVAEVHPWPWLCPPGAGRVDSFSAWRRTVEEPA